MERLRLSTTACFAALALLVLTTEIWIAPLREGGSLLALKALPLVVAVPSLWRGSVRAYQWWSMLILAYLCFGLVRGASDAGLSAIAGWAEALLSGVAFTLIILFTRQARAAQSA